MQFNLIDCQYYMMLENSSFIQLNLIFIQHKLNLIFIQHKLNLIINNTIRWRGLSLFVKFNMHWEKSIFEHFQINRNMIVVTVFLLIINQKEFHLAYDQKDHKPKDHIPFNLKIIWNKFIWVKFLEHPGNLIWYQYNRECGKTVRIIWRFE